MNNPGTIVQVLPVVTAQNTDLSKTGKYEITTTFRENKIGWTSRKLHSNKYEDCEVQFERIDIMITIAQKVSLGGEVLYKDIGSAMLYPRLHGEKQELSYVLSTYYESGRNGFKADLKFIDGMAKISSWANKYRNQ